MQIPWTAKVCNDNCLARVNESRPVHASIMCICLCVCVSLCVMNSLSKMLYLNFFFTGMGVEEFA